MDRFTYEDLALLNDIAGISGSDWIKDFKEIAESRGVNNKNPGDSIPVYTKINVFNTLDILKGTFSAECIISKLIKFWCDRLLILNLQADKSVDPEKLDIHADMLMRVFLEAPFNELPRYINNRDGSGVIARWRLKIGK